MSNLRLVTVACIIFSSLLSVDGYCRSTQASISREKIERSAYRRQSWPLQMSVDPTVENPVSIRQSFMSTSRNLMISLSVVALSTVTAKVQQAVADVEVDVAVAIAPIERTSPPIITCKVYLDIKIANYTEESTGTNKGADGSGRVVFGLYGKDAPDSVARVRHHIYFFSALIDSQYNLNRPLFQTLQAGSFE